MLAACALLLAIVWGGWSRWARPSRRPVLSLLLRLFLPFFLHPAPRVPRRLACCAIWRIGRRCTCRRACCGHLSFLVTAGYIGEFEYVDDHRAGKIVVNLIGRLNKCGVISPRFDVKVGQVENWVNNLLPSRQFGYIMLTTSYGIMDHEEARAKHTGGKILGFFY